jgi:hypothetical protein
MKFDNFINEGKNVVTVILTLGETGVKKFKTTPTFKNLLYPNQIANLQVGDNILNVNHTIWGKLQAAAGWSSEDISVKLQESIINESVEQLQKLADVFGDGTVNMTKPSIFQYTTYRLPSEDELKEFENYPNLTAEDIENGFGYTMIGRGILSETNKKLIQEGIKMLIEKYPDDNRYKDALEIANKLTPRFK